VKNKSLSFTFGFAGWTVIRGNVRARDRPGRLPTEYADTIALLLGSRNRPKLVSHCHLSFRTPPGPIHLEKHTPVYKTEIKTEMENGAGEARDPSGFLSEIIGAPVTVKLNSGVVYKGP